MIIFIKSIVPNSIITNIQLLDLKQNILTFLFDQIMCKAVTWQRGNDVKKKKKSVIYLYKNGHKKQINKPFEMSRLYIYIQQKTTID